MFKQCLAFLKVLIKTRSVMVARHRTFHQDSEVWSMIQFKDGRDPFYRSKHLVSCKKCGFEQTTYQVWPKFDADRDHGYQLAEAHQQAIGYTPESKAA